MPIYNARTRDEIDEILDGLGYGLLDEYINRNHERRVIIEDNYGYKYDSNFNSVIHGHFPNFVGINNSFTLPNISLWLKKENKNFILCEENIFKGANERLFFQCLRENCKEIFDVSWENIYGGQTCPFCIGRRVGSRNNLAYLQPQLIKEWNHSKNKSNPEDYSEFSTEKVWWVCSECNHPWEAKIQDRSKGKGCPSCAGKVVTDKNRLSILFPEIAIEWDYEKNKDTPNHVSFSKNEKRWWICENGHSYFSYISNRTGQNKNACKKCSDEQKESKIASQLKSYCEQRFNAKRGEHYVCINPETGHYLPYDIYIPRGRDLETNGIYIEVNDRQHYELNGFHRLSSKKKGISPEEEFEYQKKKDKIKRKFARQNGVYIEVDLRKIKTVDEAIKYIEKIIKTPL